jgi:hypothetical protein
MGGVLLAYLGERHEVAPERELVSPPAGFAAVDRQRRRHRIDRQELVERRARALTARPAGFRCAEKPKRPSAPRNQLGADITRSVASVNFSAAVAASSVTEPNDAKTATIANAASHRACPGVFTPGTVTRARALLARPD